MGAMHLLPKKHFYMFRNLKKNLCIHLDILYLLIKFWEKKIFFVAYAKIIIFGAPKLIFM
jgi:hypothetical protein